MTTSTSNDARGEVRIVTIGLLGVAAAAWIYLFIGTAKQMPMPAGGMPMLGGAAMSMQPEWTVAYSGVVLTMWATMMVAMMLPVGAPAIIRAVRHATGARHGLGGLWTGLTFAAAYMSVWLGVAVAATLLQRGLDATGMLSGHMAVRSRLIAGLLAIAAGLYQFSPLKQESLRRCRSLAEPLPGSSRSAGAVWGRGLAHGVLCLICIWALMLLPFIGGLMDPAWMAAAMLLALAERILPSGARVAKVIGAALVAFGGYMLAVAVL
jgi:predicted metal-binding membrane protein